MRVPLGTGLNELRPAVKHLLNMLMTETEREKETHGGNSREEAERRKEISRGWRGRRRGQKKKLNGGINE